MNIPFDATEQQIIRGKDAQQILGHSLVQEAFSTIQATIYERWVNSPASDEKGRENCYRMIWSFRQFREYFEAIIADGKLAEATVEESNQERMTQRQSARAPENEYREDQEIIPGAPL